MNNWYTIFRRVVYWLIPVVLLYLIFRQIDFATLTSNLSTINPGLFLLGISGYVGFVLTGGLRWNIFLTQYNQKPIPLSFALQYYWIGFALGVLTPASLGLDIYRVVVSVRQFGQHVRNITIVVVEKLQALAICVVLIVALYPLVSMTPSPEIEFVLRVAYLLFFVFLIVSAAVVFAFRSNVFSLVFTRIKKYVADTLSKVAERIGGRKDIQIETLSLRAMIEPLTVFKCIGPTLLLSFFMQIMGAIGNHFFFLALGHAQPLLNHVFIVAILYIIFRLPITFGGIGIREGAYILLYGLFGLPAETALLVSLFSTFALLLNSAIGVMILLFLLPNNLRFIHKKVDKSPD